MNESIKLPNNKTTAVNFFFSTILFLGLIFQGVYFPVQYLLFTLLLLSVATFIIISKIGFIELDYTVSLAALFFMFYSIIPTIFAFDHYNAMIESAKPLAFFACVLIVHICLKDAESLLRTFYYACMTILLIGLLCYFEIFNFADAVLHVGKFPRMQSVLQYANTTGILMATGFFISLYYFDVSDKNKEKAKFITSAMLFLVGLLITISKGSMIIFFFVLSIFLFLKRDIEKLMISIVLILVCIPTAFFIIYFSTKELSAYGAGVIILACLIAYSSYFLMIKINKNTISWILKITVALLIIALAITIAVYWRKIPPLSNYTATFIERVAYMQDAFWLALSRPLTGIGAGNWSSMQYSAQSYLYSVQYIHNSVLQIFLDSGIISGILFLLVVAMFYIRNIRCYLKEKKSLTFYILMIISLLFLHSLMDIDLSYTALLAILGAFLASQSGSTKKNFKLKKYYVLIPVLTLTVATIYFMTGQIMHNRSQLLNRQGQYEESLRLCQINNYFMPMSGENSMLTADNLYKQNKDYEGAMNYITQAQKLNPYEKTYYTQQVKLAYQVQDYNTAYIACEKLTYIEPLIQEHYLDALELLEMMKQNNQISINDFNDKHNALLTRVSKVRKN